MRRIYSRLLYLSRHLVRSSYAQRSLEKSPALAFLVGRIRLALHRQFSAGLQTWLTVQSGPAKGVTLHLRLPDEAAYWLGTHEPDVQEAIEKNLHAGGIAYDVGAHAGFLTACMARRVRKAGQIVAFDGDVENVFRLTENIKRNHWQMYVKAVHAAVWSHSSATIAYRRGAILRSQGGVEADGMRPVLGRGELILVPVISLDDFVARHGTIPQLIKIDVEGGEAEVLRGATGLAKEYGPMFIVEVHESSTACAIEEWLTTASYSAEWHIPSEGFPRRLFARPSVISSNNNMSTVPGGFGA